MDQLFIMQRYWGSDDDEEDNGKETSFKVNPFEKSKTSKEKRKLDLIDLDNDEDSALSNKKQKLDSFVHNNIDGSDSSVSRNLKEVASDTKNSRSLKKSDSKYLSNGAIGDPCKLKSKASKKEKSKDGSDSSVSHSHIDVASDAKNSSSLKNSDSKYLSNGTIGDPCNLKSRASKKEKSEDEKLQKKSKKITPEENDILQITIDSDYSEENTKHNNFEIADADNEIHTKKGRKRKLSHFQLEENHNESISIEQDRFNKNTHNISLYKDKFSVSPLQRISGANNEINSKKIKKSKSNEKEISYRDVDITLQDSDNEISSKKVKKQYLRNSDVEESNNMPLSIKQNQDKISESPLHEMIEASEKIKSNKIKKLKIKPEEIDEDGVSTILEDDNNSQVVENADEAFPTIGPVYQHKDEIVRHTLPHWLSNPTYISVNLQEQETPVSELNYLDHNTKDNLMNCGIQFLFPVQLAVIPWLMQSKEQSLLIRPSDICVSAPTGSGKTLAFVLPIVQSLKDKVVRAIRAVVVLPVIELAIQVYKVFETYVKGTDLRVALLTGKKSFTFEQNLLVKSSRESLLSLVDIVIATPGRIHDHIYRTQGFCLKRLRYLVIDEADRMMEEIQQGWLKQVEDAVFHDDCISSNCVCSSYKRTFFEPTSAYNFGFISQPLQKLLYSATLTHDPEQLHSLSLYKPKLFTASSVPLTTEDKGSCAVPTGLTMLQVICEEGVKPMVICHLINQHKFKRVLCFTDTVERAHRLHLVLEEMGLLKVREISSSNRGIQRKIVLNQFKTGKIDILVASDLVARGIDVENVDCVISYDIPQHVKTYIHRIGRTARAGKTGTAVVLLSQGEKTHFKKMLDSAQIEVPETVQLSSEDLKPLVRCFQSALATSDVRLKQEKYQRPRKTNRKIKRK